MAEGGGGGGQKRRESKEQYAGRVRGEKKRRPSWSWLKEILEERL